MIDILKEHGVKRKIFLLSFMFMGLLAAFPLFAEKITNLSMRYNKQGDMIRLVFESNDDIIKNANSLASLSAIKIEFPAQFEFKKPPDFFFEIAKKDRFLVINLKDVIDIKTSKLSSPSRLVFDLKTSPEKQSVQQVPTQQIDQKKQGVSQPPEQMLPFQTGQAIEKAHKSMVFVIDPGHGGYEYGIVSQDAKEKDGNLSLSKDLGFALSKKGRKVFLTRKADQSVSIGDRINFSNSKNPDLFISIHASLSDSFAIYVSTADDMNVGDAVTPYSLFSIQSRHIGKSRALSTAIASSLKSEFKRDVYLRELPLPVLYSMNAPAVLVEYPSLHSFASDPMMRARFVNAFLKGIDAYEQ